MQKACFQQSIRPLEDRDEMDLLEEMSSVSGVEAPKAIREIREADILHTTECDPENMKDTVKTFLGL